MNCPHCGYIDYRSEKDKQVKDQPTVMEYYKNTNVVKYKEWKDGIGRSHRKGDLPAYISYYESGNIKIEEYYIHNKHHRDNDKPAYIKYYENGSIEVEIYCNNGYYHRENDKPAYIKYYENGQIMEKAYYINGRQHRDNGKPACITYYKNGDVLTEKYYINGIDQNPEVYCTCPKCDRIYKSN